MLQRFFIFCSGADTAILDTCSPGEQTKYAGIGATVFFTAVMATIAGSYALFTVFDSLFSAIFFGIIWGLLIFNLDRFIVSTLKKRDDFFAEFIQAAPRIVLAIIIAIVISKPLELKIFEKEINQVLLEEKNRMTLENKEQLALQFTPKQEALSAKINQLKEEILTKEQEVNSLYNTYIAEAEGTAGTEKLGKGPVYKEKREKHDSEQAALLQLKEVNTLKISQLEQELSTIAKNYQAKVTETQPIIEGFDGLMARVNALKQLPWLPSFFIFLLFLAIETSPIIAKLLSPKGAYDLKLAEQEGALQSWVQQQKAQRDLLFKSSQEVNNQVYASIAQDNDVFEQRKKKAKALMELQAEAFFNKQKGVL